MKQNIIVVDDFYKNPQDVRNFGLTTEYPQPTDDYTYPGRNSNGSYYSQDIHQSFEKLVKEPLIPADKNGYFRISLETDTHKHSRRSILGMGCRDLYVSTRRLY